MRRYVYVQTSRTQRPGGSRLCVGGNTCGQRTPGSLQGRWLTMVPWREGKPLTWDVTVVCPLAESYIGDSAMNAGSAAEAAATRKAAKYAGLERTHIFQPVAVENLGTINASAYGFLAGLGQKISAISGDDRETCYLFQRISVLIQRFNATLLHKSFADENRSVDWPSEL